MVKNVENYFKFTVVFLVFLLLAFDRDLGMIYLLMMFADWIWYQTDNFVSFPMKRSNLSSAQVYLEGLAAVGVFLLVSTLLISSFSPQSIAQGNVFLQAQSIFQLLSASVPILQGSLLLTFIGWAVVIPIIETSFFFGRLLEGFSTYAENVVRGKISLKDYSIPLFIIILLVSALFALFHITAKGLESIPLLITFIFAVISCILVIRHQELRGAIFMHIVVNAAAVLSSMGVLR